MHVLSFRVLRELWVTLTCSPLVAPKELVSLTKNYRKSDEKVQKAAHFVSEKDGHHEESSMSLFVDPAKWGVGI